MDFNQYLQVLERRKALRGGIEPGRAEVEQIMTPYFNEVNNRNIQGRKLDLQEKALQNENNQFYANLDLKKDLATQNLALERYQNDLMQSAANTGSRNQLMGNLINTAGSLGGMYLMNKGGYFNRRIY